MKYVFHPEALSEYSQAVQYYADSRAELAQAFIDAVENTVYRIRETPTRWRVIDEDVRRCLTRKFPYGIIYTIEQEYILILAVMHCSREPGYWKSRKG
ncbi:type II toxin-antitoxin system RelE/ParE family toxin [Nodularia sp. NIES-3585]|uniref:type II toxin-antitoxin system RelE/ParE family toxin n=1 Tax=Nodularia sp. NIES-3585 TaxID=1973477 RepID=UPI000B5CA8BE|nr:type II toxin-antitoxin system RelE/ParE family toxin [Nodularia sp. NIES-3585]GAX35867.1 plasmid stabilization system [Nodularia sp. NIES-3585]